MNDSRRVGYLDGYVVLAICIATAAIFANTFNAIQSIQDFDPNTSISLTILGSVFSQTSLALAMVCAVIIGRNMLTNNRPLQPAAAPAATDSPTETVDDVG